MALLDLLGRRWSMRILWELRGDSSYNFRELQSLCDDISSSVLNSRLRELSDAGLVTHTGDGYSLTDQGSSLQDRLQPLDAWANRWATTLRDS